MSKIKIIHLILTANILVCGLHAGDCQEYVHEENHAADDFQFHDTNSNDEDVGESDQENPRHPYSQAYNLLDYDEFFKSKEKIQIYDSSYAAESSVILLHARDRLHSDNQLPVMRGAP